MAKHFFVILFSFCSSSLLAQNLGIYFQDGSNIGFWVHSIERITYEEELMTLQFFDQTTFSTNVSMIVDYDFNGVLGTNELVDTRDDHVMSLYPNPADESIYIDIDLPTGVSGDLAIFDLQGRIVGSTSEVANFPFQWNINRGNGNMRSGVYICTLTTSKGTFSKRFTIK